jgi:hypothetical protein
MREVGLGRMVGPVSFREKEREEASEGARERRSSLIRSLSS